MKSKYVWFIVCGIGTVQCIEASEMKEVVVSISTEESLRGIWSDSQDTTLYCIEPTCMAAYQRKKLNNTNAPTERELEFYTNHRNEHDYAAEAERMLQNKEEAEGAGQMQSVCAFYAKSIDSKIQESERELIDMRRRVQRHWTYCGGSGVLCILVSIGIFYGMYVAPVCMH